MQNINKITISQILLFLLLLLAFWLRFINLGVMPLSGLEAKPALSSLNISQYKITESDNQPLYISLTSLLFEFINSSNLLARFLPAFAGSVMILLVYFYYPKLTSGEVLSLALLLAIDPAFISISRQVDSRILVITFFIASMGFLYKKKYLLAGISSALLVLSGLYFWHVTLICLIYILFIECFEKIAHNRIFGTLIKTIIKQGDWKKYILCFSLSLVLFGTRFLSAPLPINQIVQSFIDYFNGWINNSGVFSQAPLTLIVLFTGYPLFILIGSIEVIWTLIEHKRSIYLIFWFLIISFFITLAYPVAEHVDIIFIIPFYFYFFIQFLMRFIQKLKGNLKTSLLATIPIISLIAIIWLTILRTINFTSGIYEIEQLLIVIIGCLLLIGIILIIVSWGWSYTCAINSVTLALVLILGIYHLSTTAHILGASSTQETEVWWIDGYFKDSELVLKSIDRISLMNSGLNNETDIVIEGSSLPSVSWLLRQYNLKTIDKYSRFSSPAIIITKEEKPSFLDSSYRGFKFILTTKPYWIEDIKKYFLTKDFYQWLFLRKNMVKNEEYYLWAQADLFPGNNIKFENIN